MTAGAIYTVFFIITFVILLFNYVDFCHDSANYASILALAAPKVDDLLFDYFTTIFLPLMMYKPLLGAITRWPLRL